MMKPTAFLKSVGLIRGMDFGDIGCGPGLFTMAASYIVGSEGRVYAIDIEERMLEYMTGAGLPENVIPTLSTETTLPLEDSSLDLALIAFTLHEAHEPTLLLKEVSRVLKKRGRVLILDWEARDEEIGPPKEERLPMDRASACVMEAGLLLAETSSYNDSHYLISALKAF